jgi:hypothetical protein
VTFIFHFNLQMECCGFVGPQEFAYSTLPIDDSCYDTPSYPETSAAAAAAQTVVAAVSNRKPVSSATGHYSEDELYDDDDADWTAASSVSASSQSPGTVTPRLKQVHVYYA